jgi:hypothetical protein
MKSKVAAELKVPVALPRRRKEYTLLKSTTAQRLCASPTLSREDVTVEYPEFQPHVDEVIELLGEGAQASPVTPRGDIFSVVGPSHDFWIQPYVRRGPSQKVVRVHILGWSRKFGELAMTERNHAAARSEKTAR